MKYYNYDTELYPFRKIVEELIEDSNLEKLHLVKNYDLYKRGTDQGTIWHKKFYENKERFLSVYDKLISDTVKPIFNEQIVYQKIPTFRVHLVKNLGVFEFHKDRQYQHNQEEINFFLPITDAYDTNTIWVESEEDKGDYSPMNTNYGQLVMWNGCHLMHGNKINETSNTRVSVDFRIIPFSKWQEEENATSINMKTKFTIGEYYNLI